MLQILEFLLPFGLIRQHWFKHFFHLKASIDEIVDNGGQGAVIGFKRLFEPISLPFALIAIIIQTIGKLLFVLIFFPALPALIASYNGVFL